MRRISRYPGVRPFADDEIQRQLLRGREAEKCALLELVLAEPLVVLFARSGVGKSSLINAGLLEPLRQTDHFPIVVRVSGPTENPSACVCKGVRRAVADAGERQALQCKIAESATGRQSFSNLLDSLELRRDSTVLTPILVIDQFEELFTLYSSEHRERFIGELAALLAESRPPASPLREYPDQDESGCMSAPPAVKVVLSLREDFYANLEDLRVEIPGVYRAPFRLKPLSRKQAERAIVEPAQLENEQFWTSAFTWSAPALEAVLDLLCEQQLGGGKTRVGNEVEPFQLQLICQFVEKTVAERGLTTVRLRDLGSAQTLKAVLSFFYEDALRRTCEQFRDQQGLRGRLERLCEYGLITARGRRLLREESTIKHDDGVEPEVLRALVEMRLLRKEPRIGDNYYELTHDALIEPIRLSRETREARRALRAQAKRKKRREQIAASGVLVTFVLFATGMWAVWERAESQRIAQANKEAQAAQRRAEREAQRAELELRRAEQAKRQALVERQQSVKVAAEARLEAGEEGARRKLAEAEARMATFEPRVGEAQKKAAAAKVQAAAAQGKDYEADAKLLAAAAEADLRRATREFEMAGQAVHHARRQVTLAAAKREVSEPETPGAAVATDEVVLDAGATAEETNARSEREQLAAIPEIGSGGAEPQSQPSSLSGVRGARVAAEVDRQEQAYAELAALEFRASDLETTDADLAQYYREFLSAHSKSLSPIKAQEVGARITELETAAKIFAELKRNDEDPNFSVCEAFDQWHAFKPRRALGPEAQHRDLRLAELSARLQESAVITSQDNFITTLGENERQLITTFRHGRDRIYMHAWVNAPRSEAVKLELRFGHDLETIWHDKTVEANPLRGVQVGYHLWTWKGAKDLGQHELRLYDVNGTLICRREYEIIAAN